MNSRAPIFIFANDPWNNYWQTRHHIAYRLAERGWPVSYTRNIFNRWDIGYEAWEKSTWFLKRERVDNIVFFWPGRLHTTLANSRTWAMYLRRHQLNRMLNDTASAQNGRPIVYVFHPSFADYLELFDGFKVIYHADDTFSAMPGWNNQLAQQERTLVKRADIIIASSQLMASSLPSTENKPVTIIPNGADSHAFSNAGGEPVPKILSAIPAPRIGYIGTINDKVDLPLLANIATARPDWHWCIAGHVVPLKYFRSDNMAALERCRSLNNVHFLGAYPTNQLPSLVNHMNVNTLIYRTIGSGWWKNVSPLKLHEYLATGLPVVSADVNSVREFGAVVDIANSQPDWIDALDRAISGLGMGSPTLRRKVAFENDWNERIDRIEILLKELITGG